MSAQATLEKQTVAGANHPVVSREKWTEARKELLEQEKRLTKQIDEIAAWRRELPWVRVDKEYVFDGPRGRETLSDLFAHRSQLIVYHFMFSPGATEGCPGCSFLSDHIDGANLHLAHHDVTLLAVSRAPWRDFEPFKKRMGWQFHWVSSCANDFNIDYHVTATEEDVAAGRAIYNYEKAEEPGEMPGISVFFKDADGAIYHTYSTYARGGDILIGAHNYLDFTPKGRNEEHTMDWVRFHDRYDAAGEAKSPCACNDGAAA